MPCFDLDLCQSEAALSASFMNAAHGRLMPLRIVMLLSFVSLFIRDCLVSFSVVNVSQHGVQSFMLHLESLYHRSFASLASDSEASWHRDQCWTAQGTMKSHH